jgi:hypothetical protein
MPPPSDRRRDPLEYEGLDNRKPSNDRSYARVADIPNKLESPHAKPTQTPPHATIEAKLKDITDPGRDALNNGSRPRPPPDLKPEVPSYGYPERYRDATGDYGTRPYAAFDPDPRGEHPYDKTRDPRDPYYTSSYPAVPSSEYRGRDAYPPRAQPPLDYARGAAYDERYPRDTVDLDPPRGRGRESYVDLQPRPFDYELGSKRKLDPEYRDPYIDEYRVTKKCLKKLIFFSLVIPIILLVTNLTIVIRKEREYHLLLVLAIHTRDPSMTVLLLAKILVFLKVLSATFVLLHEIVFVPTVVIF